MNIAFQIARTTFFYRLGEYKGEYITTEVWLQINPVILSSYTEEKKRSKQLILQMPEYVNPYFNYSLFTSVISAIFIRKINNTNKNSKKFKQENCNYKQGKAAVGIFLLVHNLE